MNGEVRSVWPATEYEHPKLDFLYENTILRMWEGLFYIQHTEEHGT